MQETTTIDIDICTDCEHSKKRHLKNGCLSCACFNPFGETLEEGPYILRKYARGTPVRIKLKNGVCGVVITDSSGKQKPGHDRLYNNQIAIVMEYVETDNNHPYRVATIEHKAWKGFTSIGGDFSEDELEPVHIQVLTAQHRRNLVYFCEKAECKMPNIKIG